MRRIWITLLAAAIVTAMAVPVGAAPSKCEDAPWLPGCAPSDEDPPTAVKSIGVHMEAEPVWVHEAADIVKYHVTLENKTGEDIFDVSVEFTAATPTAPMETEPVASIPANGSVGVGFWRTVSEYDEAQPCLDSDATECGLPATVEVYNDDDVLVGGDSISTTLYPEPPCGFSYDASYTSKPVLMEGFGICIWTLPDHDGVTKTGVWEIALDPVPPKNPNRPIGVSATVRDGVPGNWCSIAVGTPYAVEGRWKAGDDPIAGRAYLPGAENIESLGLPDGMCLNGGAGGEYFAVGNPKSFYLATTEATVTVKWVKAVPYP